MPHNLVGKKSRTLKKIKIKIYTIARLTLIVDLFYPSYSSACFLRMSPTRLCSPSSGARAPAVGLLALARILLVVAPGSLC